MSLHIAAQHLASKGRDGDTELVHMTKGEIKGLQGLALAAGGSLSINPNTGLVEANFLKRILPMVAGAALSPFITPMGAAALVGGFETVRTGDIGKGLLAGLGAYGGAGLTSGLSTAGTNAGLNAATTEATTAGVNAGASSLQGAGYEAMKNAGLSDELIRQSATDFAADNAGQTFLNASGAPVNIMSGPSVGVPRADMANLVSQQGTPFSQATQSMLNNPTTTGFKQLGSEAGRSAVYDALPKYTLPAAGVSLVNAATPEPEMPGVPGEEDYGPYKLKRLSANFQGSTPVQPNPYYRPTGLGYAAQGGSTGDIMLAAGGSYDDEPMGDVDGMAAGGIAAYSSRGQVRHLPESVGIPRTGIFRDTDVDTAKKDALSATMIRNKKLASGSNMPKNFLAKQPKTSIKGIGDVEEAAAGGSIGGYSDGGRMLKGPGDGMSDSIPATIGKRQPARLADGEFVVPADVVSHLGNGSTDAGAKKLYSMMDKVRRARTGKKKQAPAVKADKYLPA
jgi:hypothetical protein